MAKRSRFRTILLAWTLIFILFAPVMLSTTAYADNISIQEEGVAINSADADNGIMAPVVDAILDWTQDCFNIGGTGACQIIGMDFSPSFWSLLEIEDGDSLLINTSSSYTKDEVMNNVFFTRVWTAASTIGLILSTVLFLFNEFLCVCGQANQIKDSPLRIFGRYIVVTILIYISKDLIYIFVEFMGDIWDNVKGASSGSLTLEALGFYTSWANDTAFLGIQWEGTLLSTNIVFTIFKCVIMWKFFKGLLHLYLEILQRYFIFMILSIFMPAAFATFTSRTTNNILHSYFRMVGSQVLVMMVDMLLMKIFISLGSTGGWTKSIINMLAAFAYLKVAAKFDSFLQAMGLNIGQTGGALGQSIGGSLRSGLGLLSSLFNGARMVSNTGGKLLESAAANRGDWASFQTARAMQGRPASASDMSKFSRDLFGKDSGAPNRTGSYSFAPGDFYNATMANGFDTTMATRLERAGVNTNNIAGMETQNGTFKFMDSDGNIIASMDKNKRVYNADNSAYDFSPAEVEAAAAYDKDVLEKARGLYNEDCDFGYGASSEGSVPDEIIQPYYDQAVEELEQEGYTRPNVSDEDIKLVKQARDYDDVVRDDAEKEFQIQDIAGGHMEGNFGKLSDEEKAPYIANARAAREANGDYRPQVDPATEAAVQKMEDFDSRANERAKILFGSDKERTGDRPSFENAPTEQQEKYIEIAKAEMGERPSVSTPNVDASQFNGEGLEDCEWAEDLHATSTPGHWTGTVRGVNADDDGKEGTFKVDVWDDVQHPEMATKADMTTNYDEYRNSGNLTIRKYEQSSKNLSQMGQYGSRFDSNKRTNKGVGWEQPSEQNEESGGSSRNARNGNDGNDRRERNPKPERNPKSKRNSKPGKNPRPGKNNK